MPAPDMLGLLMQRNTAQAPTPDLSYVANGMRDMFAQLEARKERERLIAQQAEDRKRQQEADQHKRDMERRGLMLEQGKRYLAAGQNESAAKLADDMRALNERLGLPVGPGIVGGDTGVYDRQTQQEIRNFGGDATTAALEGIFGKTEQKHDYRIVGSDRTGRRVIDLKNPASWGGGGDVSAPAAPSGGSAPMARAPMVTAPVAPAARGGGRSGGGGDRRSSGGGGGAPPRKSDPMVIEGRLQAMLAREEKKIRAKYEVSTPTGTVIIPAEKNPLYHRDLQATESGLRRRYSIPDPHAQNTSGPPPKPAKVSAAVDEILRQYNLLDEGVG